MTSGLASSLSFCRTHIKLSDSKVYERLALLESPSLDELTQELNPMDVGYHLN